MTVIGAFEWGHRPRFKPPLTSISKLASCTLNSM
jgi:hypothetical protein